LRNKTDLSALGEELMDFFKMTLKHGIGSDSNILEAAAAVVEQVESEEIQKSVLGMLLSHSKTIGILLGSEDFQKGNINGIYLENAKKMCASGGILKFLDAITAKNKSLISSKHVPVLLGAYNASLSENDQIIFKVGYF
jgi:hypothetical protein